MTTTAMVPRVSGGEEEHGHLEEFRTDPIDLMKRIRDECGDVGWFQLVDKHVIFLSGAQANEFFFRSSDEDLDQPEAYPFMTPIFGKGVVFDASLERGTDPLCYVDPYLPIESFQRRDEARVKLVALVQEIMDQRLANPPKDKADRDMLDVLVSIKDEEAKPRFSADEVTGMFISLMFAGHHTSSGTSAWTLIELIRNPAIYAEVRTELDDLYADGQEVSFHALRQIPLLDNVVKETLRLHPPLIILMR